MRSWNGAFSADNLALAAVVAAKELRVIAHASERGALSGLARERAGELMLTVVQLVDALELDPDRVLADALERHQAVYGGSSLSPGR